MTLYTKDSMKLQIGKQSSMSTGVAATAMLPGIESVSQKPQVEVEEIQQYVGLLSPLYEEYVVNQWAQMQVGGVLNYEDVAYWLDMFMGEATPGAAPGYLRTYNAPVTTPPTNRLSTFEWVDNRASGVNYQAIGMFVQKFSIKQEIKKVCRFSSDLLGYQIDDEASPASLSLRTANAIRASHWSLYVDSWAGTIGTTAVPTTMIGFELNADSMSDLWFRLGDTRPGEQHLKRWGESTLRLYMEFNATSKAFLTSVLGSGIIERQIRLVASGGTNKTFTIDFAGSAKVPDDITPDENGIVAVDLTFRGKYNPTLANWLILKAEAEVASLT